MPDTTARVFVVECKGCQRTLATTALITDPEIATIREHVKVCCSYARLTNDTPLGEVLFHIGVSILKGDGSAA